MSTTTHWVHNLNPIVLQLGDHFAIRWYGLAYMTGFIIAYFLLRFYTKKKLLPFNEDQISTIIIANLLGVFIGGRLGYMLLYAWPEWFSDPLLFFKIWQGGMSSHGGFVGVLIAIGWIAKRYQYSYFRLNDLICTLVPPGLFLGRMANFINGELWGKISTVPWAVVFPQSMPGGSPIALIPPRHPSQIYEALLEGLLLLCYTQWRLWKSKALLSPGRLSGEFLFLYAVVRIVGEQFREPDASLLLGMSRGIFYSLFIALLGSLSIWLSFQTASQKKRSFQGDR
ncbi:prolipoprotein diacylglyceryl transferase, partial [bacterium]|nr:prolipoprotein diacylglyceryl transferase [bacterium]